MTHAPKTHSVPDTSTRATLHKPVACFLLEEEIRLLKQEIGDQTFATCMARPPADSVSKDLPRV